jgi:hypothetical protein
MGSHQPTITFPKEPDGNPAHLSRDRGKANKPEGPLAFPYPSLTRLGLTAKQFWRVHFGPIFAFSASPQGEEHKLPGGSETDEEENELETAESRFGGCRCRGKVGQGHGGKLLTLHEISRGRSL